MREPVQRAKLNNEGRGAFPDEINLLSISDFGGIRLPSFLCDSFKTMLTALGFGDMTNYVAFSIYKIRSLKQKINKNDELTK